MRARAITASCPDSVSLLFRQKADRIDEQPGICATTRRSRDSRGLLGCVRAQRRRSPGAAGARSSGGAERCTKAAQGWHVENAARQRVAAHTLLTTTRFQYQLLCHFVTAGESRVRRNLAAAEVRHGDVALRFDAALSQRHAVVRGGRANLGKSDEGVGTDVGQAAREAGQPSHRFGRQRRAPQRRLAVRQPYPGLLSLRSPRTRVARVARATRNGRGRISPRRIAAPN